VVAARRGEADIVLGNVVGSNVFNILCIFGASSLVLPLPVPEAAVTVDLWIMIAFSLVVVPFLLPDLQLGRKKGLALLALYGGYVAFLFV
jgi:cation:H+ antiporter